MTADAFAWVHEAWFHLGFWSVWASFSPWSCWFLVFVFSGRAPLCSPSSLSFSWTLGLGAKDSLFISCHAFLPYSALVWWAGCVWHVWKDVKLLSAGGHWGSMQSVANEDIAYFLCKRTCLDRPGQRRLQLAINSYSIFILYTFHFWMSCWFLAVDGAVDEEKWNHAVMT